MLKIISVHNFNYACKLLRLPAAYDSWLLGGGIQLLGGGKYNLLYQQYYAKAG
jgi:hypothetical protein